LVDDICQRDDYDVRRTESALMQEQVGYIASVIESNALLMEYGSGNSLKTLPPGYSFEVG
jgi:uncharacterized SAM-dependent methyltransferase